MKPPSSFGVAPSRNTRLRCRSACWNTTGAMEVKSKLTRLMCWPVRRDTYCDISMPSQKYCRGSSPASSNRRPIEAKLIKENAWSLLSSCSEKLSMIARRIIAMCHLLAFPCSVDVPGKKGERRLAQNPQVQPDGPAIDVGQIGGDAALHLVQGLRLAPQAGNLGQPGDARGDAVPDHVSLDALAVVEVVQHRVGARPHQGHVAAQHIEQLRQFVQRAAPQQPPDRRDSGIVTGGLAQRVARVMVHGAELPELDDPASSAVALPAAQARAGAD